MKIWIDPDIFLWYQNNSLLASLIVTGFVYRESEFLIRLSSATFFVYLFHFSPIFYLLSRNGRWIDTQYIFYLTNPFVLVVMFSCVFMINRLCPSTYSMLTGGRTPMKTSTRLNGK